MKIKITTLAIALNIAAIAQTGFPPAYANNPNQAVNNANFAWYRGGNLPGGPAGTNNIFGTMWNSPIYTQTNGKTRMVVNEDKTTTIAGYTGQVTNGFVGIGVNNATQGFPWSAPASGPISLLHLNSGVGGFVQQTGWRPWMKYGITSTHNQDFMFVGQRATSGLDVTDAVIGWADNSGNGAGQMYVASN